MNESCRILDAGEEEEKVLCQARFCDTLFPLKGEWEKKSPLGNLFFASLIGNCTFTSWKRRTNRVASKRCTRKTCTDSQQQSLTAAKLLEHFLGSLRNWCSFWSSDLLTLFYKKYIYKSTFVYTIDCLALVTSCCILRREGRRRRTFLLFLSQFFIPTIKNKYCCLSDPCGWIVGPTTCIDCQCIDLLSARKRTAQQLYKRTFVLSYTIHLISENLIINWLIRCPKFEE